jgi:thiamine biosynthesis lipoprotein
MIAATPRRKHIVTDALPMSSAQQLRIPFRAMASGCEVVMVMPDEQQARLLAQAAIAEVQRIEQKYSRYQADSIVSLINAAAGLDALLCDEETWSLLNYADTLYKTSDALFDITAGVLRRAWNFKTAQVPTEEELTALRELIGWSKVERDGQKIRLPIAGMEIDFGGFGKEYAADRAAALLYANGVRHGYVNLGGDMRVIGPKPDDQPWMMGIQDPRQRDKMLATIPMESGGLATSGDYERYFEIGSQRYCHVLDPHTGQPVTYWRSVSVIAPLAVVAGNCSTIAMLKQAEGLDFLEASGMNYLAVDRHGITHVKKLN